MHLKLTISCFNMIQIIIKPSQYFRSQTKIKIVLIDRETDYHTAPKIYLSFVFLFSFHREINEDASSDCCNLAPVALLLEYWCVLIYLQNRDFEMCMISKGICQNI